MTAISASIPPPSRPERYHFGQSLLAQSETLRKRDRTRARILAAGGTLLDRISLGALTVSAICKEARIAHGTFYLYFSDRHVFVADLLERFVDFLQSEMQQASRAGSADNARAATEVYYLMFGQNPGLMKCLVNHLEEYPASRKLFQKLNRDWMTNVVDAAERKHAAAGRAGAVPRDELFRRAYALGGMVDQYLTALFLHHDQTLRDYSKDKEAVIETLTLIWKRGMAI